MDLVDRFKKGELLHADSIHFPDSLRYQTLKLKRTVYGGGGIMPDIFVPLDTTRYTDFHRKIVARGIVNKVCTQYIIKNREELKKKYPTFEKYKKEFQIDDTVLNSLISVDEIEKTKMSKVHKDSISIPLKLKNDRNAKQNESPKMLNSIKNNKDSIDLSEFEKSKPLIKLQMKALVARDLWEMNEYYQIMDADNESLQKAINILQTPGAYEKILK
jgi:carboxyl-terminal processing protease